MEYDLSQKNEQSIKSENQTGISNDRGRNVGQMHNNNLIKRNSL